MEKILENNPELSQDAQNNFESDALIKMQKARAELLFLHPFFGSLALKLNLKADKSCSNLWTDGKTLAYNPHFISMLKPEQVMASQAHEILHIACGHHIRRNGRDENLWNKACDYAIGALMFEAGFSLPENMLHYDKAYENKSVDEIYISLASLNENDVHGGAQNALTAEQTDRVDEASLDDAGNSREEIGTEVENESQKATSNGNAEGDEQIQAGSDSLGADDGQDGKDRAADFFGEIRDHPMLMQESDKNQKIAEEEALIQITQAIHSAKGHGDVPQGLMRLYKTRIRPSLDWQVLLQRFLENCNDGDYSWSIPNKRYISQDIYLPSRHESRIPTMALAIDASGSIDNELLAIFCAELENILESYDTNLFIMYHDIKVQKHDFYSRADRPLRMLVQGGGGTSYKHVPEYIEQENINPTCLLWFTDFECDAFPDEPMYPVLWISTKALQKEPPFGEVISLTEDV